jgi:hypothetical protein
MAYGRAVPGGVGYDSRSTARVRGSRGTLQTKIETAAVADGVGEHVRGATP